MPPNSGKKRKRSSKALLEYEKDNQSRLIGFRSSIVKPIADPESKTLNLKNVSNSNNDENLLNILNSFDLNHNYGPCSEISRFQRLERSRRFGISVDFNVEKAVNDYCKNKSSEVSVSIIDKLMKYYAV